MAKRCGTKKCRLKRRRVARRRAGRGFKLTPAMLYGVGGAAALVVVLLLSQQKPAGPLMANGQTVQQAAAQAGF